LPRIQITIIRITTTAPAGKTLTARRSHVCCLSSLLTTATTTTTTIGAINNGNN